MAACSVSSGVFPWKHHLIMRLKLCIQLIIVGQSCEILQHYSCVLASFANTFNDTQLIIDCELKVPSKWLISAMFIFNRRKVFAVLVSWLITRCLSMHTLILFPKQLLITPIRLYVTSTPAMFRMFRIRNQQPTRKCCQNNSWFLSDGLNEAIYDWLRCHYLYTKISRLNNIIKLK